MSILIEKIKKARAPMLISWLLLEARDNGRAMIFTNDVLKIPQYLIKQV